MELKQLLSAIKIIWFEKFPQRSLKAFKIYLKIKLQSVKTNEQSQTQTLRAMSTESIIESNFTCVSLDET
jgi:hypothetical protein